MKLGVQRDSKIKDVVTIVHPRTFARSASENRSGVERRKRGRPRRPEQVRQLIVTMAKATGWGYRFILGELKKLCLHNVSSGDDPSHLAGARFQSRPQTQPRHVAKVHRAARQNALCYRLLRQDGVGAPWASDIIHPLLHSPSHPPRAGSPIIVGSARNRGLTTCPSAATCRRRGRSIGSASTRSSVTSRPAGCCGITNAAEHDAACRHFVLCHFAICAVSGVPGSFCRTAIITPTHRKVANQPILLPCNLCHCRAFGMALFWTPSGSCLSHCWHRR
jgi:hypothetical protein